MIIILCGMMLIAHISYKNETYRLKLSKMTDTHNIQKLKLRVTELEKQQRAKL